MLRAPVYSPTSVGFIERLVRIVKESLKKWAHEREYKDLDQWPRALPEISAVINNRLVRGLSHAPSDVMLGWPLRCSIMDDGGLLPKTDRAMLAAALDSSDVREEELRGTFVDRLEGLRNQVAEDWIDRAVDAVPNIDKPFEVGEWVWEYVPKTRDIKSKRFNARQYPDDRDDTRANVFKPRWTGPWEVDGIYFSVSVWICDVVTGKRRRRVHVNSLKPHHRRPDTLSTGSRENLPHVDAGPGEPEIEAEDVIYVGGNDQSDERRLEDEEINLLE